MRVQHRDHIAARCVDWLLYALLCAFGLAMLAGLAQLARQLGA